MHMIVSSKIMIASKPGYRRCIAVDETKLYVKDVWVYIWSVVDVDSGELLALEASYNKSCLNILTFLKKILKLCINIGLEYRHERLGLRSSVERFFRYLKEKTMVFHHRLSARNYIQGVKNLNLFTLYYQTIRMESG